tara:strand:+ start:857 stop:1264 length:408 start_codon:yes stop_codon:yes gene_type:complete
MDIRGPIIETLQQDPNELSLTFFDARNMSRIQTTARQRIQQETGLSIDRQDQDDLGMIMRFIYITNVYDPYNRVKEQIKLLNERTLDVMLGQIRTGLAARIGYLRDISKPIQPIPLPVITTTYGNKMGFNNKIGL